MRHLIFIIIAASTYLINLPSAIASTGQPFEELQNQINAIQAQLDGLQQNVEVTVDCSSDSISNALGTYRDTSGTLTINVEGTCIENVVMNRNNVLIRGVPGTLRAQTSDVQAIVITGKTGIRLENLGILSSIYPSLPDEFIRGGEGVEINLNSTVEMQSVNVAGFDLGVFVNEEGVLNIDNSMISSNSNGMTVARGGFARLSNMQFINNNIGLEAREQGRLHIGGINATTTISGGLYGMRLRRGGAARINSGLTNIIGNSRGIRIDGYGLLEGGGGVTITNNGRGIWCRSPFTISVETLLDPDGFLGSAIITDNTFFDVDPVCLGAPPPPPPPL